MKTPAELAEEFHANDPGVPDYLAPALVRLIASRDDEWRATVEALKRDCGSAGTAYVSLHAECDRLRASLLTRRDPGKSALPQVSALQARVRELEAALRRCWKLYDGKSTTDTQALERIATVVREALGAAPAQPDTTEKP